MQKKKKRIFYSDIIDKSQKQDYIMYQNLNISKMTVTRTVGLRILERVAGWCEAMVRLSNDLSPLSRRTESESK